MSYQNVLYSYRFYIYQRVLSIIVKDSSSYICKNILYYEVHIYQKVTFIISYVIRLVN